MNIYKDIIYLLSEISLAIIVIILGYYLWDNFDLTNYNIAKYYDSTKEVQIAYDSNINNKDNNIVLSIHNVSDKVNNKDIILKVNRNNKLNGVLNINTVSSDLNDLFILSDEFYNYYMIDNINLEGYETIIYFIDFKVENNIIFSDYDFVSEI